MNSTEMVSLRMDPTMVRTVLEKQIQVAIVEQLGNQDQLIAGLVKKALSEKVNDKGNKTSSSYDNRYDWLEIVSANAIRDAAKSAMEEWMTENSHKVREAVMEELRRPDRQRSIATAYADAIENSITCKWDMKCNIDFKRKDED